MSRKDTRERIIDAALEIFSEKGYVATTTKEIAVRAEVNEVTIFRHFGSKENVFQEALTLFSASSILNDELDKNLTGDIYNDLKLLANAYLDVSMNRIQYIRMSLMEMPRNSELSRVVSLIRARLSSHLAEYLYNLQERGKIPEGNFELLGQMFYNLLFQYVLNHLNFSEARDKVSLEEYIETCAALFVSGITNPISYEKKTKGE